MDAVAAHLLSVKAMLSASGVIRDPTSLFALLAVTVVVLYGLSVGRTRALVSLLCIYVAYVLTLLFPFAAAVSARLPDGYRPFSAVGLFLALYLVVFGLISHSMRRARLSLGEISFLQVMLISLVQIGLLTSIAVSLLPADVTTALLGSFRTVVAGDRALWLWAAASLAILPLMRARRKA